MIRHDIFKRLSIKPKKYRKLSRYCAKFFQLLFFSFSCFIALTPTDQLFSSSENVTNIKQTLNQSNFE